MVQDIHEIRHVGLLIGYCDHQVHRLMTQMLRQYDVSPMQCRTLTYLNEVEGDVNQRMLERHLMVKPSTASGIVGRLEDKGLVRRQTSGSDGRCRILALTDEGRQFYQQFRSIAGQVNDQAQRGFSQQEKDTLRQLLVRLADNLTCAKEDAK